MKRLSFETKQDLLDFTETFKKEYSDFFKQNLSKSKTEKFIAKLAGKKNYNTLLGSLMDLEYSDFKEFENLLYSVSDLNNFVKNNFPKNLEINVSEEWDHGTYRINRIAYINNYEIMDVDTANMLLKNPNVEIDEDYKKSLDELMKFYKNKVKKNLLTFVLNFCIMCSEGLLPNRIVEVLEEEGSTVVLD